MFTISLFSRIDRCAHRQSWPESLRAAALFQNVPVPLLLRLSWLCPSHGCESRVSARYFISGYAASGQTQGRAAMSSVPPSLSVHPHGETPTTNMTRFMCYPITGEWWGQGKYSVVLNRHHCSTWEEKPIFQGKGSCQHH